MKLLTSFFILLIFNLSLVSAQTKAEITQIKLNYINSLVGVDREKESFLHLLSSVPIEKEVSDQNVIELQQFYPIEGGEIKALIAQMRGDGSWADINYADTKRSGWEPKIHAERILKLTKYYYTERSAGAKTTSIVAAIGKAMDYWFDHKLVCKNWWYNEIGIPRTLGPAFLLFETEMTSAQNKAAIEVMLCSKFGMTGQNKVWLAGNVLIRALLQNDVKLMREARDTISSEIVLGKAEGIKPDWSFHQHGPQQQFGNYGLSFICNMSFYCELFSGSSLAFDASQKNILVGLLLNGYQWIVWRGYWDVNALNRQLFHSADIHKSLSLMQASYSLMKGGSVEEKEAIKNFVDRNFISPESENRFVGNKHFSNSDLTIHRTKNWMASLRMASMRVIGTEQINEDNLKGYYMADGAIYIYSRGDDYHNIFPFWDWRRIPGITTYKSDDVIPIANSRKAMNHTFNVGGVSDCSCGVTAMELNRNDLKGYKSWIFTDDFVFCMGSGIESDSTSGIITSIDQRFSRGKIYDCGSGRFFHDNMGYIILQADSSVCRSEKREGRWCDIMGMYAPQKLESEIFSLYIEHKINKPSSYLYLMLPASTKERVENFDLSAINIVRNDKKAQVVIVKNRCYIAAYQPIDISLGGLSISIIKPGTYIANATNGEIISAAPFVIETASE